MSLTKEIYWKKYEEDILSNNFSNSSKEELQNLLPKRTWKSITRKAERMQLRRLEYLRSLKPKNHDFFKKWSEEMVYILGFITADGCIAKNNCSYKLHFNVHKKDKDILEKIRERLSPKNRISHYKKEDMYQFSFASTTMYNDLIRLGITPRKTFKVKPPKIPKELIKHYLRGYFDGDGCISIAKRDDMKRKFPSIRIIGNMYMINYMQRIFNKITSSKLKIHKTYSKGGFELGNLYYTCKNAMIILNFLYKDSNIYLDRKYNKYKYIREAMPYEES